jgi:hypothetical protein
VRLVIGSSWTYDFAATVPRPGRFVFVPSPHGMPGRFEGLLRRIKMSPAVIVNDVYKQFGKQNGSRQRPRKAA